MYKNVFVERGEEWNVWDVHLWDDDGYKVEQFQNFAFVECSENQATHRGINNEPVKKIHRWGKDTPNIHYGDHTRGNIHIKYLVDKYGNDDTPSTTHNEMFFDIEIEMGGALTPEYIKSAPKPITSIAWWDKRCDEWKIIIVDKKNQLENYTDEQGREVIPTSSEQDLISVFLDHYERIAPDILVGYNSDYFDIPYLFYRIRRVMGERYSNRLSPIRTVREQTWSEDQPIKIAGVSSLDYFRLHKKYHHRDEPSMKLDYLGEKYVDQKKIEYEGTLDTLFRDDINKFIEYNFVDVLILKKLDEKLQYIDLTKNIAHKGKVQYDEVYVSTRVHDGAISAHLLEQGIAPPNKDPENEDSGYSGGYLFCPQTGVFEFMFDEDLTSLYPCIAMSLNIGRDSLIFRILTSDSRDNRLGLNDLKEMDPDKSIEIETYERKRGTTTIGKILKAIEANNYAISANGVVFRTDTPSTLTEVLDRWFGERVYCKGEMKKAYKVDNDPIKGAEWHLKQYTLKILINSLCMATARPEFRYGNVRVAEAITLTGQRIIQDSGTFINRKAAKLLKPDKPIYEIKTYPTQKLQDCFNIVMYEDTDSCYVHAKPILDKLYPDFDTLDEKDKTNKLEKIALEYQEAITEYYNEFSKDVLNLNSHRLEMKTECVIRSAFFSGKRRYAQHITKKEGIEVDEVDIKGLDFMKSNFPPVFGKFFNEILLETLHGAKKEQINKKILSFKNNMETMSLSDLAKPTSVKKIKRHIIKKEPGQIFSGIQKAVFTKKVKGGPDKETQAGAPAPVKGAIFYNDLLDFKKLGGKHTQIVEGDKVKWVYLKQNPYKIETLSFLDYDLPEEIEEFLLKYVDRPRAFDTILKNKLESFYEDLNWGGLNLNPTVEQFFKFI